MSKKEFAALVERALSELPDQFARFMDEVTLEIRERPSRKLLKEMGMEEDELLFGLYQGVSLMDRGTGDSGRLPDHILIFQEDHELQCDSKAELVREIRTTVLHEIGHFFGMDEDDLDKLGYQ